MRDRLSFGALLLACVVLPLTSCSNNPELTSITVNPGSVTTSPTAGLRVDFTAIGYYTHPGHAPVTKDITTFATWTSAAPQFVVIGVNTGVATVTGYGTGNIDVYAAAPGFHGDIVGTAIFNISATGGAAVRSLALFPTAKAAGSSSGTVQFMAIGRTAAGESLTLPGQPIWFSTDNEVATIDKSSGLLTTLGQGRTTITAVYTNPDGTTAVGKTYFNVAAPQ